MNIAERGWTAPALVALSLTTLGLMFVPGDCPDEPIKKKVKSEHRCGRRAPTAECPSAVRAQAGLDGAANVACVRADVGEPAYFVFGHYRTTEAWERIGVVSADATRVLVPFVDRPSRANQGAELSTYRSVDLDGDGRAELIGTWSTRGGMRHEVFTVTGDELKFAVSADQPAERLSSPCSLRVRGAEVLLDGEGSCRVEHGLRFTGSRFTQL